MALDSPKKILQDVRKVLQLHAALGLESYVKSEGICNFLERLDTAAPDQPKHEALSVKRTVSVAEKPEKKVAKLAPQQTLADIRKNLGDCTRCGLHEGRTRILFGSGPATASVLIVGEWPNRIEDAEGLLFSGEDGGLLKKMLQAIQVDINDVYLTTIVKCRASEENPPQKEHIAACRPFLLSQIDVVAPRVILTMGPLAAQSLLSTNKLLVHLRGRLHRLKTIPLIPTFHPSYLLKNPEMKKAAWIDLQLAQRELNR